MIPPKSFLAILLILLTASFASGANIDFQTPQDSIIGRFVQEIQKNMTSDLHYAHDLCTQALEHAHETGNLHSEILILNLLADTEFRLANYAAAVENGSESIRINATVKDSLLLANAYRIIGNVHTFGLKQYDQALRYQTIALEIFQKLNDKKMIAAQYGSITWIYGITGTNTEEGLAMATEGIRIAEEINDLQLQAYNYNSKGIFFLKMGVYDSAILMLTQSNTFAKRANDQTVQVYNKTLIGEAYFKKGEVRSALQFFKEAVAESKAQYVREIIKDAYLGMANCYEALGETQKALDHFRDYSVLKDSLLNSEVSQKALFYRNRLEEERQQAVVAQLEIERNAAVKEKQLIILLFVLGMLLLLAILGFILFNSYQRKRANKKLHEMNDAINSQNLELEELNGTKDKLFSIIGHDLRSPIGNLRVLLDLFKSNMMNSGELNALLPKLNKSVGGLHEMLDNLLEWSHSQMQGFKLHSEEINLKQLAETTLGFYQSSADEKGISIFIEVPDGLRAVADQNHVLLVMRNLVNNAIKYTENGGRILIGGNADGNLVQILIKDTGVGMSIDQMINIFEFRKSASMTGTQGEKGTGFGLALCKEMVEANGGSITVRSEPGKGSEFTFSLKGSVNAK